MVSYLIIWDDASSLTTTVATLEVDFLATLQLQVMQWQNLFHV
ncbi:MAG: hypothetical protein WKG06_45675 [Segetibacter sp.]